MVSGSSRWTCAVGSDDPGADRRPLFVAGRPIGLAPGPVLHALLGQVAEDAPDRAALPALRGRTGNRAPRRSSPRRRRRRRGRRPPPAGSRPAWPTWPGRSTGRPPREQPSPGPGGIRTRTKQINVACEYNPRKVEKNQGPLSRPTFAGERVRVRANCSFSILPAFGGRKQG